MEYGIDAMLPRPESLSLRFVCVVSLSLSLSLRSIRELSGTQFLFFRDLCHGF